MCNKQAKSILGSLAFIGIGVAIGLLVAPQKGSDTRNDIKRRGQDCLDYLSDLATPKSKEERVVDTAAEEGEGLIEDIGRRAKKVVDEATS